MCKLRGLRNASIVILALGTAYGLGVLSCVYWELKLLATYSNVSNKAKQEGS